MKTRSSFASLLLAVLVLAFPRAALAVDPAVIITSEALMEQQVARPDGKLELVRVPAGKVIPGGTIIFVNSVTNNGTTAAEKIVVTNPIPEQMLYLDGSAAGQGTTITFSIDGGQSFDLPGNLKVKKSDGTMRPATAADYTHLRWVLNTPLAPRQTQHVEYRARVK